MDITKLASSPVEERDSIPFNFFAHLLGGFQKLQPKRAAAKEQSNLDHLGVFKDWVARLKRSQVPYGTSPIVFRLLFPDEDSRRKYGMQEDRLGKVLANVFGLSTTKGSRGHRLATWKDGGQGCLGLEVAACVKETYAGPEHPLTPTLHKVDRLLDELASKSAWSNLGGNQHAPSSRSTQAIFSDLFKDLTPLGASVMTQIILKDLRPLMYTLTSVKSIPALLEYNSKAYTELTKEMAMKAWHPSMLRVYKVHSFLDVAAAAVERLDASQALPSAEVSSVFCPVLGIPIEIPKCTKGHSCSFVIEKLRGAHRLYAETKYDGERMQIHIDFSLPKRDQIRIFSKSKRNSTKDRIATHEIIRAALGYNPGQHAHEKLLERLRGMDCRKPTAQKLVLEAEMVAYCEERQCIDEFWRIRGLIAATASGIRRSKSAPSRSSKNDHEFLSTDTEDDDDLHNEYSQNSLASDGTADNTRHFMVVFFDILFLDGTSLLEQSYERRRHLLEGLIQSIPGFSQISAASQISIDDNGQGALQTLQRLFAEQKAEHEEGLVIKSADSKYNDYRQPWIKLKSDYIPGLGDTLDFVVLGAAWSKDRARDLGVGPAVFTTFYVGCLANLEEIRQSPSVRPHFEVFFVVEYGLQRAELEDLNFRISTSGPKKYNTEYLQGLPYSFNLLKSLNPPRVMFSNPILVELEGAGFTKSHDSPSYELRFPRMRKVWRKRERHWHEGVSLADLHKVALEVIGRDSDEKVAKDAVSRMWRQVPSPGVKCPVKKRARTEDMVRRLQEKDIGRPLKRARTIASGLSDAPHDRFQAITNLSSVSGALSATPILRTSRTEEVVPNAQQLSPKARIPLESENVDPGKQTICPRTALVGKGTEVASPTVPCSLPVIDPKPFIRHRAYYWDVEMDSDSDVPLSPIFDSLIVPGTNSALGLLTPDTSITTELLHSCTPPSASLRHRLAEMLSHPNHIPGPSIPLSPPSSPAQSEFPFPTLSAAANVPLTSRSLLGPIPANDPYLSPNMTDAFVWIGLPIQTIHQVVPAARHVVPQTNRLNALEAFLIAAGWTIKRDLPIRASINRGIIFIDHDMIESAIAFLKEGEEQLDGGGSDARLRILVCPIHQISACSNPDHVLVPAWMSR